MASLIGSMYVSLTADFAPFQRNMRAADGVVGSTAASMRRNMGLTERSVTSFQRSMNGGVRPYALIAAGRTFETVNARANLLRGSVFALTAAFGGLGAAVASNVVARYFDTFTGLENQIRVVADGAANLSAQIANVAAVADRSRGSLQATATLYSRLAKAAPEEGAAAILRRVETINKALVLGGATAQESYSAAIQFSQAIASNRLGGEEMRAILETPLGLELAKGLGVTIGKFREMGFAGELTADILFGALDKISNSVDAKFADSIQTIDQSIQRADNALVQFAGRMDDTYGVTKLLASGINAFADNVDTLLPLVGQLAAGLGIAFAGRGLGGFTGARLSGIRREVDARKEMLRLTKEEATVSRVALAEAAAMKRRAQDISPDRARDFAPKSLVNAYKRDLAALSKEDERRIALQGEYQKAVANVGQVTRTTTVGSLRAAENLAAAQIKVNDLQAKSIDLARQEEVARRRASVKFTSSAPGVEAIEMQKQGERDLARILREREVLTTQIGRAEASAAERQLALAGLRTKEEVKFANERAAALTREANIRRQMAESDARRVQLAGLARTSNAAATTAGMTVIGGQQADTSANLSRTAEAARAAAANLTAAQRAASGFGIAMGVAGRAAGSLVGFLGGPWGVAFTAAIGIMAILGMRAQRTAQEIARAREVINEELEKLGVDMGGTPEQQANIQAGLLSDQILAETDRLRDVEARLESIKDTVKTLGSQSLFDNIGQDAVEVATLEKAWHIVTQEINAGTLAVGDMADRLRELGVNGGVIAKLEEEIRDLVIEGKSADIVIETLRNRITELDGQRARVLIDVEVNDPWSIITGSDPGMMARARQDEIKQRALYGRGQRAALDQRMLGQYREDQAADAGDPKNTASHMRRRTTEILEQASAFGMTRKEAEALAKTELDAAEADRLNKDSRGSAASKAAKEYENFANKIAELRERAAASGLSELDQEVVQFAEKLKNGAEMMRQYTDAIANGDLSKAPAQLREVRDALLEIRANQAVDGILQQYGTGAQLVTKFAEQQEILNLAVMNGDITAQQASLAYADFIGQFGQYEWIDNVTNALTSFAETAITDFENIGDAAMSLVKELAKVALQITVLEPLKNGLRSWLGGGGNILGSILGGGGGGGGSIGSVVGGKLMQDVFDYHSGGRVGTGTRGRSVSPAAFIGAPRFHSGLRSNELAAVLERGEEVLTAKQSANTANIIGGLASRVSSGGGGPGGIVQVRLSKDLEARILDRAGTQSVQIVQQGITEYDEAMPSRVNSIAQDPWAR